MDPAIWGPDQWKVLFDTAKVHEQCREERDSIGMKQCQDFLFTLADNFLCEHCGYFFSERLSLYNTGTDMVDWMYNLKSIVTNKIHICKETVQHCNVDTLPQVPISRLQFYNRLFYEDYHLDSWIRNVILVFYVKKSRDFFLSAQKMFQKIFKTMEFSEPDDFFSFLKVDWKDWVEKYIAIQVIS
jgi:hypothetical protein